MKITFDFGPKQDPITEDRIREMVNWVPWRVKLDSDWTEALHPPRSDGENWSIVLPFWETFGNAFRAMYPPGINYYLHRRERFCIFLNDSQWNEDAVAEARSWLTIVGNHVAIRDCLAVSFALDYRMEAGNPQKSRTYIGQLCRRAKPYEGDTSYDAKAAEELAGNCVEFLQKMTCYNTADSVIAVPPSRADKPFDLPRYVAGFVASALGKTDLCDAVTTTKPRSQLKATSVGDKLDQLRGTIQVVPDTFKERSVLVFDDLYQSGTSINYVGMLLQLAGARRIFGLACEKTLGNFDNLGSRVST